MTKKPLAVELLKRRPPATDLNDKHKKSGTLLGGRMRTPNALVFLMLLLTGCTHLQLERSTLHQVSTQTDLHLSSGASKPATDGRFKTSQSSNDFDLRCLA